MIEPVSQWLGPAAIGKLCFPTDTEMIKAFKKLFWSALPFTWSPCDQNPHWILYGRTGKEAQHCPVYILWCSVWEGSITCVDRRSPCMNPSQGYKLLQLFVASSYYTIIILKIILWRLQCECIAHLDIIYTISGDIWKHISIKSVIVIQLHFEHLTPKTFMMIYLLETWHN